MVLIHGTGGQFSTLPLLKSNTHHSYRLQDLTWVCQVKTPNPAAPGSRNTDLDNDKRTGILMYTLQQPKNAAKINVEN